MNRLNKLSFFLIWATVIFTTLAYGTVHQPVIAAFYVVVAFLAILWSADSLIHAEMRFSRSVLQIPLAMLFVYAVIQVIPFGSSSESSGAGAIPRIISVDPFSTQVTALHILAICVFFALTLVYLDNAARLRRIVTVLTIFGFIYAFYAILQFVLSPDKIYGIYKPQSARPFGSFVNRHDFAAIIEMVIAIPIGMIFSGAVKGDKRLLYFVAIALMASAMLLSGSRGGLVALIAEIVFIVIITSRVEGRKNVVLKLALSAVLVVAAVGGAVLVGGDTSLTRFSDAATSDNVSSSRTQIWGVTLKVIGANMPFGAGLGAFGQAFTRFDDSGGLLRVEQAHNDYLQVLADSGVVGLIIGGLFLFWFFREGMRKAAGTNTFRRGAAVGAFAGCFAILIHSLFDFVLHITAISIMFTTLMAMLVASGREFDDDEPNLEEPKKKSAKSASVTSIEERQRARVSS